MATAKKTAAKAETKTAAKKTAAKAETKTAAKAETKAAAKTETKAAKTETKAAKTETAAKKPAAKKAAEPKFDLFIQYAGATVSIKDIDKNVKKVVKGKKAYTVYVKPDESKAYIVADGETTGMDVFFVAD